MEILDPEAKRCKLQETRQNRRRDKNPSRQGEGKTGGGRRKKEGEETRGESHKRQRHGMARHYFNFFALILDVRSCPGLLPGIRRTGIGLEVGVIHE